MHSDAGHQMPRSEHLKSHEFESRTVLFQILIATSITSGPSSSQSLSFGIRKDQLALALSLK